MPYAHDAAPFRHSLRSRGNRVCPLVFQWSNCTRSPHVFLVFLLTVSPADMWPISSVRFKDIFGLRCGSAFAPSEELKTYGSMKHSFLCLVYLLWNVPFLTQLVMWEGGVVSSSCDNPKFSHCKDLTPSSLPSFLSTLTWSYDQGNSVMLVRDVTPDGQNLRPQENPIVKFWFNCQSSSSALALDFPKIHLITPSGP